MNAFETSFAVANIVALAGWLGLAILPGRRIVVDGIAGLAIPLLLAVAYTALVAAFLAGAEGGFGTLAAVRQLFASDALLLAGWLHYLAFDLFVGAWIVRTARREGVPHILVLPCLAFTFLLGPMGFLAFNIVRLARCPRLLEEI